MKGRVEGGARARARVSYMRVERDGRCSGVATIRFSDAICKVIRVLSDGTGVMVWYILLYTLD
jgi:hypothetical protein